MKAASRLEIRPVDIKNASREGYAAFNAFANLLRAERLPDDPPRSLEETIQQAQNIPPFVDLHVWVVDRPDNSGFAASSDVQIVRLEQNQHIAPFSIDVLPEFREQGLEVKLLGKITEVAEREGRSLLISSTNSRVPSGEALMRELGAEKALESHTNQLDLLELDRKLIEQWIGKAAERAGGFELLFWEGAYPEKHLAAIAELMEVMNTAPRGSLQVEDFKMTPELLRQIEQATFATGNRRWTMVAQEKSSGRFAGYTELSWNPRRGQILNQLGTGVLPEYRNFGIGRWLKAAMLDRVLRELPEARFVRTGNADSNAPMLKINHALGFKPYTAEAQWQIETTRVREYLDNYRGS
ncbi:GNAT family N-acetyltransferase [uncultured Meiothermus sp.]|jgi:GNAT superfamily N-acetyltransferase|uniref:GNAT family N-acetyltransferase n=1 Tax=uncultured Meiothermus sp. TaxID=157471 RepID=UPI0026378335|nr:GNAT family N-acetyltransferase [uncultured Meiothermus sp.]